MPPATNATLECSHHRSPGPAGCPARRDVRSAGVTKRAPAGHSGPAERVLRRSGPGHRHRGACASSLWPARLRSTRDRPQQARRRQSARQRGRVSSKTSRTFHRTRSPIFSAHGVSRKVADDAGGRGLQVIDATCPLVSKVHNEARRYAEQGLRNRPHRTPGTPGGRRNDGSGAGSGLPGVGPGRCGDVWRRKIRRRLSYVTQTTLSVDDTREIIAALEARFPEISGPDLKDICYATQNRQTAVRIAGGIGATWCWSSAPTTARTPTGCGKSARRRGPTAISFRTPAAWNRTGWTGPRTVGITAGASAPEVLVQDLIDRLRDTFEVTVSDLDGSRGEHRLQVAAQPDRHRGTGGMTRRAR